MRTFFCSLIMACLLLSCGGIRTDKDKQLRILTCGIRHESNTFSTLRTGLSDFNVQRGPQVLVEKHLWSEYLKSEKDVEIIPTLHAYAWPGGMVTKEAYEQFKSFVGDCICFSHAWNEPAKSLSDGRVMQDNLELWGKKDTQRPDFRNLAPWFKREYARRGLNISQQCSGEVARLLGGADELTSLNLDVHNALYDVYSLLIGLRKLGFALNDETCQFL